ncbi:Trimeric GatFAB AmidoTransferase(AdT) complex subunit, partial [Ascosphaera pollenicola]
PDNEGGSLYANTRGNGFGEEVKRRILLGAFTLSADAMDNYFIQAQKVRRLVQRDFNGAFGRGNPLIERQDGARASSDSEGDGVGKVDVLVCPTAPSLPPTLKSLEEQSPLQAYVNDVFTVPSSLAGLPSLSVPVPLTVKEESGVSTTGMQVIGQFGDDQLVLDVGEMIHELRR